MAERVHPHDSTVATAAVRAPGTDPLPPGAAAEPPSYPKSGTYIIQLPKNQIYRLPSPESARRFQEYSRRAIRSRRRTCRCCLASLAATLILFLLALAVAAGIMYLVLRPELPRYSLSSFSINGLNLNLTSAAAGAPFSIKIDAAVVAENPNKKIGIRYRTGARAAVSYSGVALCDGAWPAFYQGSRSVTVIPVAMRGSGIRLGGGMREALVADQRRGAVPMELEVKVPVRVKVGAASSWTVNVKVRCDVTVDKLTPDARIVSDNCKSRVGIF